MIKTCLSLLTFLSISLASFSADPFMEKSNIFEAGKGGYAHYRIPGIVITEKGTLLAFCEARKTISSDWATIDILMRRSKDYGKTWSKPVDLTKNAPKIEKNVVALKQNLAGKDDRTYNNPVVIIDQQDGAIHFLFCAEYARCYYMKSIDDGKTFSQPIDITSTFEKFRPEYDWKVLATGPGHSIQLKNGRLIVPVWLSTGTGGHAHRPSCISVIYSDDHGKTWERGDIVSNDLASLFNPSETLAIQLNDGRVMLNIRNESRAHRRAVSFSKNGSSNWSKPVFHDQLFEPICMANILRLTEKPEYSKNRIIFVNPDNKNEAKNPRKIRARKNVTIKLSYDEGDNWTIEKSIEPGISGYSDLAVGKDGAIYCFYERGTDKGGDFDPKFLCVAKFNLEWLTYGEDSFN